MQSLIQNKLIYVLFFLLLSFVTFLMLIFVPRNNLGKIELERRVMVIRDLHLSKSSYVYVVRREYVNEGIVNNQEIGISRLLEPGVYKEISFGEMYIPQFVGFGDTYLYLYHEDGDMVFDPKKDFLVGKGTRLYF